MGFSTMSMGLSGFVELHHAVLARFVDVIGEHGRAILARHSIGKLGAHAMAIEHVVAEDQRDAIAADELPPQDEGMGEPDRLVLDDVVELDAPGGSVAEQALIERQVLARRNQQDVADSCQHQHRQRIVDHRLVVDRQQLLVDGERGRIEPRARAAGENDALHGMSLLVSRRSIVSASASRHGRGCDAECAEDGRAIEPSVGRADRGRRIVDGADRDDLRRSTKAIGRHVDDRLREFEPGRVARAGEMIDAVGRLLWLRRAAQRDVEARPGDVARRGRAAALVGDDGQPIALGGKPEDGLDEILADRGCTPTTCAGRRDADCRRRRRARPRACCGHRH